MAALEEVPDVNMEDLGLDFTVPGYDIELKVTLIAPPNVFARILMTLS